jgi:hypothetical protein
MSEDLAESAARLERLVAQMLKETDPAKYDELGSEIWRILGERERLTGAGFLPRGTERQTVEVPRQFRFGLLNRTRHIGEDRAGI